uniref:Photosystem I assembly protein Ycf3 n=1 Tax=Panagrolaimus sp. PS1159 TaxID=55785 RepID=A0AC35G0S3_9BILA
MVFFLNFDFSEKNAAKIFHKKKILQKISLEVDKLPEITDPEIQIKFNVIQNLINNSSNEEAALQFKEMLMDFEDNFDHEDLERIINAFAYIFTYQNNIEKAVTFYYELFNLCENSFGNQGYFVTLILQSLIAFCDIRHELGEKIDAVECSEINEIIGNTKPLFHVIYHFAVISQINEKWEAAEFYFQKLIKLFGEKLKAGDFAIFWNELAIIYQIQKKFFETEQICRQTLKSINENPKVNDVIRAKTFHIYASVLQAQKRNKESKMYFLKALKIYEENLLINDKTVADILYNLGKICKNATSSNQRKKAYQYFRRALEIQKLILDPMDLRLADILVEISNDHDGDYDERESMLKQALEIHEYNEDSTSLQLGDLFFAAASNHIKLENENTETLYLKALKIYGSHQNYENCPSIYIILGDIYEIERKYDLAEFHYQKLLKIYESDNDEIEQTGQALRLLAFVCKKQTKFDNSLFYSFKALKLYEKEFSVYEFEISLLFSNVGSVYQKQGNFKEAIKYYQKTLEIEAINRPNHFRHANALKNLGIVNQNLKDYKEAEYCFWQSLEICKSKSEESISAKLKDIWKKR